MKKFSIPTNEEARYNSARLNLLLVAALTLVNIFAIYFAESYFLFSAYIPHQINIIGYIFYLETGNIANAVLYGGIALALIVPYVVCYFLSKKHVGWMIGALAYFVADSVWLFIDFFVSFMEGDFFLVSDFVIHVVVLAFMIYSVVLGFKATVKKKQDEAVAKALAQSQPAVPQTSDTTIENNGETQDVPIAPATRKLSLTRVKSLLGCAIPYNCFINNAPVCTLKNGHTETLEISTQQCSLGVMTQNGNATGMVTIPAGENDVAYEIKIKAGFMTSTLQIIKK